MLLAVTVPLLASASTLGGVTSAYVSAGSASIAACDSDGFDAEHVLAGGYVTAIVVSGIADPGCEGAYISVTVTDAGGGAVGASERTAIAHDTDTNDNSVTLAIDPQPLAADADAVHVAVEGPT